MVYEFAVAKGVVRLQLQAFRGKVLLKIARWWTPIRGSNKGQAIPAGGVTIRLDQLKELEAGIGLVRAAASGHSTAGRDKSS